MGKVYWEQFSASAFMIIAGLSSETCGCEFWISRKFRYPWLHHSCINQLLVLSAQPPILVENLNLRASWMKGGRDEDTGIVPGTFFDGVPVS
jgi:hypothetical protein